MIDLHYDLLTDLYLKIRSGKTHEVKVFCNEVYHNDNITGGILNLYFMSKQEMLDELSIEEREINVLEMMRVVTSYIESNELLDPNSFVFSIEGCDYIEDIEDIEVLYKMGLRAIVPVWNEPNKFGSGIRSKNGLTDLGKELINRAIDLGIGIDLSHANENTFWDIIKVVKEKISNGESPIVYASHSNSINLCNRERNLSDKQILAIKDVDGIIGITTIKGFIKKEYEGIEVTKMEDHFIEHIGYVASLLGGFDNIAVSTDDMNFDPDPSFHGLNVFNIKTVSNDLRKALSRHGYGSDAIQKLMIENGSRLIRNLNGNLIEKRYHI